MKKLKSGGGWPAILYSLKKARQAGGFWKFYKAMRSKNACKTCALGMGGQKGGMVNEAGHFPEVCKKSMQAMVADMQKAISTDFWNNHSIDQLQKFTPRQLEESGRLVQPVIYRKGSQNYQPISWDDAIRKIVGYLKEIQPDQSFWYFSGRSSNEAGFALQLFARIYGTNNVNNCSYYCHQASGVGLSSVTGSGTATVVLEDLDQSDLVILIGGNPASNHPRLMRSLMQVRRRGGEVIVINPVIETGLVQFKVPSDLRSLLFGSKIASLYVQPHIGGDLALLYGIAKHVLETGAHDESFLQQHCHSWPELRETIQKTTWQEITEKSGVNRQQIEQIAKVVAKSKRTIFCWTMGITHHRNGVENVQAIANLALIRGMVGKPGAGLMPIRGHSNVQGIGSVGVTPKLKDAIFQRLETHFQVKLPTTAGQDTLECMNSAAAGRLKFGFCLGGNLYGSNPDSKFAASALSNLKLLVSLNTTLNTGHAHGLAEETIILPVLARDEEPQSTTQESMFNYIRLSDGGPRRSAGPKSEIEIIANLARLVLQDDGPIDWQMMANNNRVREVIAKVVPGFEKIAEIDQTRQEFQISGRTFHQPQFATATKKAQLHCHQLPDLLGHDLSNNELDDEKTLRLMTVRSEGQFNTVVYEEYDLYRGQDRRDIILVHPSDLKRFNFSPNQLVTVYNETGQMQDILIRPFAEIRDGNALMYFPEANVLVPRTVDPVSQTPAYKNVLVSIKAQ